MCSISASTLERHRNDLIDLKIEQFSYTMYSACYSAVSAECIWQYCQLVRQIGLVNARERIKNHLKEYFNGQS
jgi:hypothetical protein